MKTKTRYREPKELAEKIAEDIPPSEKIDISSEEPATDAVVIHHEADQPPSEAADEATLRLRKQIDDLKKSENLQRQQQAASAQPTPAQVLQFWKQNGLGESGEQFLLTHPQHIVGLTDFAARQATQQGHQPGSAAHTEAAKTIFHQSLRHLESQQAQATTAPVAEPPQFFRPPPPPEPPSASSIVSAPVSRTVPDGTYREPSPNSVKLSPDELAIAKASGISPVEYAKNKLTMLRKQRAGEIQN